MKLEFSKQIFEKYSNIIFHDNKPSGSRVVPCGQTDGRKNMTKLNRLKINSRFSPFCTRA